MNSILSRRSVIVAGAAGTLGAMVPRLAESATTEELPLSPIPVRLTIDNWLVDYFPVVTTLSLFVSAQAWDGQGSLITLGSTAMQDFVYTPPGGDEKRGDNIVLGGPDYQKSFDFNFDFARPEKLLLINARIVSDFNRIHHYKATLNRDTLRNGVSLEFHWQTYVGSGVGNPISGQFFLSLFNRLGI